nr:hypothetical protein [Tanacetum cinerariifolium]
MDPEEEDGDDEKSKGDSIDYLTSRGDDDADDDGDDLSKDDADDEDEEEPSDSEEEEDSDQTEPFKEGETAATPPPSAYRVTTRISVRPHIPMPFPSKSEKRARFTTPTSGYEVGESSGDVAARQIRPALTVDDSRRAEDRLIGRLRRERRYFRTMSTTYVQEVAHSCDYCTKIMDYY